MYAKVWMKTLTTKHYKLVQNPIQGSKRLLSLITTFLFSFVILSQRAREFINSSEFFTSILDLNSILCPVNALSVLSSIE